MIETTLPFKVKAPILACGADVKAAFAIADGDRAMLMDGFGDLGDPDNFTRYEKAIRKAQKKFGITPRIIACDLHPAYHSGILAQELQREYRRSRICKIQHHEAHIASAIVDNSIRGDVIGAAFDGTGFGSDGNVWGGEFFAGSPKRFIRIAHLEYIAMPGADIAVREPWRMAVSYLYKAFGDKFLEQKIDFVKELNRKDCLILKAMIDKRLNSPVTSSVGRLFDAVGSMVLLKTSVEEEAEIPIALEKAAIRTNEGPYGFEMNSKDGMLVAGMSKTIREIVSDLSKNIDPCDISDRFHATLVDVVLKVVSISGKRFSIKKAVLSGGVFQNRILRDRTSALLKERGFNVYMHSKVPINDSGIPIGQIAIANARAICA